MIVVPFVLSWLFPVASAVSVPANQISTPLLRAPARKKQVCDAMDSTQLTAQRLTCLFETGKSQLSTGSVENLGDGRGQTCGWAGFTTADEEVVACVETYTSTVPDNPLAPLLPQLRQLQAEGSDDVSALNDAGFPALWRRAAKTNEFNQAYAEVVQRIFGDPTRQHVQQLGLQSPVATAILFDSCIQHGDGDDPDSLPSMIERTRQSAGEPGGNEAAWLQAFLEVRRQTLLHPHNQETRSEWRKSVSRVDALALIARENPGLQLPIQVKSSDYDEEIN